MRISLILLLITGVMSVVVGTAAIVGIGNANAPASTPPAATSGSCHVLNSVTIDVMTLGTSAAPGEEPDVLAFWFSRGDVAPCLGDYEDGCWVEVAVPPAAQKTYPPGRRHFIPVTATNSARRC